MTSRQVDVDRLDQLVKIAHDCNRWVIGKVTRPLLRGDELIHQEHPSSKEIRLAVGIAQTTVADAMGVSKSAVAQLEGRDIDSIQVGTLNRYFAALGYRLQFDLEPLDAEVATSA